MNTNGCDWVQAFCHRQAELSREKQDTLTEHLQTCDACLDFWSQTIDVPTNLKVDTLNALSLDPCSNAQLQILELESDQLEPLLSEHLSHCSACQDAYQQMTALQAALSELKEPRLDELFVADVLRKTSRRRFSWFRMRGVIHHMIQRPRFALELAYAFAILIFSSAQLAGIEWVPSTGVEMKQQQLVHTLNESAKWTQDLIENTGTKSQQRFSSAVATWQELDPHQANQTWWTWFQKTLNRTKEKKTGDNHDRNG